MYLINWNPDSSKLEATFGGRVTAGEASVFSDEMSGYLSHCGDKKFTLVLDYATTSRMDDGVMDSLRTVCDAGLAAGAAKVSFIARNEQEAIMLTDSHLQAVLDGREEYLAGHIAA